MEHVRNTLVQIVAGMLHRLPENERAIQAWQFAAGEAVAEKARATAFADGVLTVEVQDATWRKQLHDMAAQFLATLNHYAKVARIEFVLPQTAAPVKVPYKKSARKTAAKKPRTKKG